MKIGIVTDDNSGFPKDEIERLGLFVIPMPVVIDGQDYFEGRTITAEKFYELQAEGHAIHTAQPMIADFYRVWDEALSKYDQILFIGMSSGLTGAIDTAKTLAMDDKYVGKVFVVDNHRISVTLRHSIYDAKAMIEEGMEAEAIRKALEETASQSMIYIMVDTLEYLKKGGRITPAAAALGSVLNIKPVLKIEGGKLDAKSKQLGAPRACANMIRFMKEDIAGMFQGRENLAFAIAYTHNEEKAKLFRRQVAEALSLREEDILMDPLSLSVAVHIGPGSLALACSVLHRKDEMAK